MPSSTSSRRAYLDIPHCLVASLVESSRIDLVVSFLVLLFIFITYF